jgi:hypothetical protein
MKTIAGRGLKILKMVFRGISVSVVSLILQACFGILLPDTQTAEYGCPPPLPPENQETSINGKVVSKKTGNPINGIKITIDGTGVSARTDMDGNFYLWVRIQDRYKLKFEDIDGSDNGGLFLEQTWTLNQNDTYNTMLIGLDLDTKDTQTGCCQGESETHPNGGEVKVE